MADDTLTLPTVREGWYVFAKAAAAPNFGTVVWPTAVVEAFMAHPLNP